MPDSLLMLRQGFYFLPTAQILDWSAIPAPLHRLTHKMEAVFTSDLAATLLALVKAGEGIAWLPNALAAESEKNRAICRGCQL
ncbi:MAG: hypothetical protein ACSLEN_13105 [Candidatus Malihini olakiniferum]